MALEICGGCQGLLPRSAERCPNCQRSVTPVALRWAKGIAAAAGSGVAAVTLMACYGVPCAGANGACGEGTGGGIGSTGLDSGNVQYYQYCPWPDGGLYPCWPDGGEVDLDAGAPTDGGDGDGGSDAGRDAGSDAG
ncbi:MAG: hypothetical protein JST54_30920 [Deltaproteobacteria bacterium]|nr:hypothetical protein [Deltaproteobacteria bacterium]